MENEKIENLLQLSLAVTGTEREKSSELSTGYNEKDNTFQVIVRYVDNLKRVEELGITVDYLLGEYAIFNAGKEQISTIAAYDEIIYIEQPKKVYYQVLQGKLASCITPLQSGRNGLSGKGILVGVIDSGIDFFHPEFIKDGSTRILSYYDQWQDVVLDQTQINEILSGKQNGTAYRDSSGHGTAVASVAAGNSGVAYEAELVVVKLGNPAKDNFFRTSQLMQAIDFCIRVARREKKPIAINLSFGNCYGDHYGTSLIETFIDQVVDLEKVCICVGNGNEGTAGGHCQEKLTGREEKLIELAVEEFQSSFSIQLWKNYADRFEISLESPGGKEFVIAEDMQGIFQKDLQDTRVLCNASTPVPYRTRQEIYFDLLPAKDFVDKGIWRIRIRPKKIVNGEIDLYLPAQAALSEGTRFLLPSPERTITIPATARKCISVGAYNSYLDSYAEFSGRGYTFLDVSKPDLLAPGVNIRCAVPGGGYENLTGTSIATPFVTGSCALMMEWGIVNGNDPYLYGEKVKAFLHKGARQLPYLPQTPNEISGYGRLCLDQSIGSE